MRYGWSGKILRINLSDGSIRVEDSSPYLKKYIGGRILAARLAWENIPAKTEPYDTDNTIIITTGPLSGTIAPTSGRTIMGMISPVPYPFPWYTHSTIGGWFATQLKTAGFDAMVVKGTSSKKVYIKIVDDGVQIEDASGLWGKDAIVCQDMLKKAMGPETQVMAIGPAGENVVHYATVQHDYECAAGHSGFGAVWGSKKLKAIAVTGTGSVAVSHPNRLINEWRNVGKFRDNLNLSFLSFEEQGEDLNTKQENFKPICTQSCVNNCHVGNFMKTPDGKTISTFCLGLEPYVMDPPTEYKKDNVDIKIPQVKGYSQESSALLLDLHNRLGFDYWFRITFQPWLTALKNAGIHEIRGYPIKPDEPEWFMAFIQDVAQKKGIGEIFCDGFARALESLQDELPEGLIALGREMVFGFGFQAHREGRFWDNEPLPFWIFSAMMYVSETRDPTIGSHALLLLAEILLSLKERAVDKFRKISEQIWQDPGALEPNFDFNQKAPVAIWSQRMHQLNDSLPLCDFAFPIMLKEYESVKAWLDDDDMTVDHDISRRFLNAVTGESFSCDDLLSAADRGLNIERCLLARAGRSRINEETLASHFELPCRDDDSRMTQDEFIKLMDTFFMHRRWDQKDGWPLNEELIRLDLADVADELIKIRN